MTAYRKKLIEVALPLEAINAASAREKSIRHGHPSTLHLWWARRPLAACRAVLFGQLVDDPSSWPELFPTEGEQDRERQRLFRIIEEMVPWENSNNETVINAARLEIARSVARNRKADGDGNERDDDVLAKEATPPIVNRYLAEIAPPVHDPFAGGGSIPLEAQRLGLRAVATDLNPVAVLINKALIEIPPKFAGMPPVNPEARKNKQLFEKQWKGAEGLAEDVRYYGKWMRDEAVKRIGHLYPPVKVTKEMAKGRPDLVPYVGKELTVIAWLWARTVASPNPAVGHAHVPLLSALWLSKKAGQEAWAEPVVDRGSSTWSFRVRLGLPRDPDAAERGTRAGKAQDFLCLLTGVPIQREYIRDEGKAGRLGVALLAVVAEAGRRRIYLSASSAEAASAHTAEALPEVASARCTFLSGTTPTRAMVTGGVCSAYGLSTWGHLFTARQLVSLTTLSDLIQEARSRAAADACESGLNARGPGLEDGGVGNAAYADAVAAYLGLGVSKSADYNSVLVQWSTSRDQVKTTFTRQALPMIWDFGEVNPFAGAAGDLAVTLAGIGKVLCSLPLGPTGMASAHCATTPMGLGPVAASTDPPYFDNISYAELSDYFYGWLRRSLRPILPRLFATVLTPKEAELVATPHRHGGQDEADLFFMQGMGAAVKVVAGSVAPSSPMSIYYAFKQTEEQEHGVASTGWEAFLEAVLGCGCQIVGTWPIRTERGARSVSIGRNALASSVALVCRLRAEEADVVTRSDFRRLLRQELPKALKTLQKGNIAPVDMAQASIGPGMAIFSRHSKVMEADGSAMTVRTALQLINEALDEYLAEQTGEFGPDTRFAVTWFETHGFETGPFGEAETLAKARNVSVQGVVEAGIIKSAAGKVRLLKRKELPDDWTPETDSRLTIWECTQYLIRRLENQGEDAAADLLARIGHRADPARDLAYRLYQTCERKGWADEARAYNGLVVAWPELARLAVQKAGVEPAQREMFT